MVFLHIKHWSVLRGMANVGIQADLSLSVKIKVSTESIANITPSISTVLEAQNFNFSLLKDRTHGQKGTQICDPLANKCPESHDSISKT